MRANASDKIHHKQSLREKLRVEKDQTPSGSSYSKLHQFCFFLIGCVFSKDLISKSANVSLSLISFSFRSNPWSRAPASSLHMPSRQYKATRLMAISARRSRIPTLNQGDGKGHQPKNGPYRGKCAYLLLDSTSGSDSSISISPIGIDNVPSSSG